MVAIVTSDLVSMFFAPSGWSQTRTSLVQGVALVSDLILHYMYRLIDG